MQVAATTTRAFSRFLLEMALDKARMRERLAARLLQERARRGGGDARRFPQPEMASLLNVSLRTYQGWESETILPSWRNLEGIASALEWDLEELFGDESAPDVEVPDVAATQQDEAAESVLAAVDRLETELREQRRILERLDRRIARSSS